MESCGVLLIYLTRCCGELSLKLSLKSEPMTKELLVKRFVVEVSVLVLARFNKTGLCWLTFTLFSAVTFLQAFWRLNVKGMTWN